MVDRNQIYVAKEMIEAGVEQLKLWKPDEEPIEHAVGRIYGAMESVHDLINQVLADSQFVRALNRLN